MDLILKEPSIMALPNYDELVKKYSIQAPTPTPTPTPDYDPIYAPPCVRNRRPKKQTASNASNASNAPGASNPFARHNASKTIIKPTHNESAEEVYEIEIKGVSYYFYNNLLYCKKTLLNVGRISSAGFTINGITHKMINDPITVTPKSIDNYSFSIDSNNRAFKTYNNEYAMEIGQWKNNELLLFTP